MAVGGYPENLFFPSSEPKGQLTRNLVGSIRVFVDKKELKLFRSEIQDGLYGRYLGKLFCASPERKGHLTQSLVESIGVTCR